MQNEDITSHSKAVSDIDRIAVEIIKRHLFHGHELDVNKIAKEMEDCVWYLALGYEIINIQFDEIINMNIDKLKKRYPDGFSFDKSIYRDVGES